MNANPGFDPPVVTPWSISHSLKDWSVWLTGWRHWWQTSIVSVPFIQFGMAIVLVLLAIHAWNRLRAEWTRPWTRPSQ